MSFYRSTKYRNRKCVIDGISFDSKKEANRYKELSVLLKQGIISDLRLQVKYELIPCQREASTEIYKKGAHKGECKPGKVIEHPCYYVADFDYYTSDGIHVVEDTKGFRTHDYIIKRKLMLYIHGIRIKEI